MASSADSAVLDRVSAGSLTYEHGVYGAIAYRAVRAVRGVIDTSRSVVSGMLGRFGGNKAAHGILCRETGEGLVFDVPVIANKGADVRELCRQVQESIAAAMYKMTDRSDLIVNVSVKEFA